MAPLIVFNRIHNGLRDQVRESAGARLSPLRPLDAQAVKTAGPGEEDQGYDGFKKIKGRQRSIAIDVMELLLVLVVHSAGEHDKKGGRRLIEQLFEVCPTIRKVWTDGGYYWQGLRDLIQGFDGELETILPDKSEGSGFNLCPWCWIVERTFAWLKGCRKLAKDYELTTEHSWGFILLAMTHLMVKRLAA